MNRGAHWDAEGRWSCDHGCSLVHGGVGGPRGYGSRETRVKGACRDIISVERQGRMAEEDGGDGDGAVCAACAVGGGGGGGW